MFEKQEGLRTRTEHLASRNGVIENPPMGMDDLPPKCSDVAIEG